MPPGIPMLSKTSRNSEDKDSHVTSPCRNSSDARDTANRMLSPVLSRAYEQQRDELGLSDESDLTGDSTIAAMRNESEGPRPALSPKLTFKATAQVIQALTHPVHMPRVEGGEGIRRLVETREKNKCVMGMSVEYWDISLFSVKGRAWPMLPQIFYILYSTAMVAIVCTLLPNYKDVGEFQALQFPISTLGLALFLLLSFRTNSSYERWWEGRKCWDGISVHVQDSARIALGWVAPKSTEVASKMVRWLIAFVIVAKKALRVENEYPELAGILSEAEIQQLQEDLDPVELVQGRLTELNSQAADLGVSIPIYATLDGNIKQLTTNLTAASRILSTPMPFAYIVHLRSFMLLWLLGLPFAFVSTLGWWSILVCTVVGYELLGFETIGVEIENPFGRDYNDLPLDLIASELFVRLAGILGKMGHMVDVDPILSADPMIKRDYITRQHDRVIDALQKAEAGKSGRHNADGGATASAAADHNGEDAG